MPVNSQQTSTCGDEFVHVRGPTVADKGKHCFEAESRKKVGAAQQRNSGRARLAGSLGVMSGAALRVVARAGAARSAAAAAGPRPAAGAARRVVTARPRVSSCEARVRVSAGDFWAPRGGRRARTGSRQAVRARPTALAARGLRGAVARGWGHARGASDGPPGVASADPCDWEVWGPAPTGLGGSGCQAN